MMDAPEREILKRLKTEKERDPKKWYCVACHKAYGPSSPRVIVCDLAYCADCIYKAEVASDAARKTRPKKLEVEQLTIEDA